MVEAESLPDSAFLRAEWSGEERGTWSERMQRLLLIVGFDEEGGNCEDDEDDASEKSDCKHKTEIHVHSKLVTSSVM